MYFKKHLCDSYATESGYLHTRMVTMQPHLYFTLVCRSMSLLVASLLMSFRHCDSLVFNQPVSILLVSQLLDYSKFPGEMWHAALITFIPVLWRRLALFVLAALGMSWMDVKVRWRRCWLGVPTGQFGIWDVCNIADTSYANARQLHLRNLGIYRKSCALGLLAQLSGVQHCKQYMCCF